MSDTLQDLLRKKGRCCITGKPLYTSDNINLVQLDVKAKWKYPVWGNIFSGQENMAMAVVHDDAIVDGQPTGPVLHAIEITGGYTKQIVYHEVAGLK